MIPAAVERAQALLRHVRYIGAPLNEFVVPMTKPEGFDVVAWLRTDLAEAEVPLDYDQLDKDIACARQIDDPWFVLNNFHLYGLVMVRREDLH